MCANPLVIAFLGFKFREVYLNKSDFVNPNLLIFSQARKFRFAPYIKRSQGKLP